MFNRGVNEWLEKYIDADAVLYINKEKAVQLQTKSSSQWLEKLKEYNFDTIVHRSRAIVNPKSNFSFKKDSDNKKNITANNEYEASDNKKPTSYTKAEAVGMVDGIMESLLSFEWGYGELKNRASVIKQAHAMLNGAEAGKRHGEALNYTKTDWSGSNR